MKASCYEALSPPALCSWQQTISPYVVIFPGKNAQQSQQIPNNLKQTPGKLTKLPLALKIKSQWSLFSLTGSVTYPQQYPSAFLGIQAHF